MTVWFQLSAMSLKVSKYLRLIEDLFAFMISPACLRSSAPRTSACAVIFSDSACFFVIAA